MSKKSMGLKGATDYGAGMRAHAQAAMPEICGMKKGGKPKAHHPKPAGIPPQVLAAALQSGTPDAGGMPPPPQGAMPPPGAMPPGAGMPPPPQGMGMKKGGKPRHLAMGGATGAIRKGGSTPQGAPKKPSIPAKGANLVTPKFKGKPGIGGGR